MQLLQNNAPAYKVLHIIIENFHGRLINCEINKFFYHFKDSGIYSVAYT